MAFNDQSVDFPFIYIYLLTSCLWAVVVATANNERSVRTTDTNKSVSHNVTMECGRKPKCASCLCGCETAQSLFCQGCETVVWG